MLNVEKQFDWDEITFKNKDFDIFKLIHPNSNLILYKWFILRFEIFTLEFQLNDGNDKFYDMVWEELEAFTCVGLSRFQRRLFLIYIKTAIFTYKGIRHFLGLPVRGNRTWSNRKNPRKNQDFLMFYQQMYFPRRLGEFNKSRKKPILYAEFLNKIYFIFFRIPWLLARNRRIAYIRKGSYLEWRFDLRSLLANRVIILDEKKEKKIKGNKKKKQKKKYRIKKHYFNLGFDFNFSLEYEKKMFKHFFVTKRSFIPKKKKKKNNIKLRGMYFLKNNLDSLKIKTININFGPQHPAAHGVLRLVLKLNHEMIINCDPNIGLLHRGTEKLIESKMYINSLPYFDRLDYVSTLLQEHAYCLNIETLTRKKITHNAVIKTRTVFDELTRILNHYLAISCHALDVGSMSPVFWAFEDREKIMEFYEYISGARMHASIYKPLYRQRVMTRDLKINISLYLSESRITLNEINNILTFNKIWKRRLKNNGRCNIFFLENYGVTGVFSRSLGLKRDLRLNKYSTYNNYYFLNMKSYITKYGDSYDRFILRMYEINESLNIINQNLIYKKLINNKKSLINKIYNKYNNMEAMIAHFKYWSTGFKISNNILYRPIESSKGEFGVTLISDDSNIPYRCKIRSPSFHHLFSLTYLAKNVLIADLVTLIGTIDIVFGEIDR